MGTNYYLRNKKYTHLYLDGPEGLHIGKSSCGWHFLLCIYLNDGIYNLEDWKNVFFDPETEIFNEYREAVSAEEMIKIITERKGDVTAENSAEELARGTCEIGLNGLLAHKTCVLDFRKLWNLEGGMFVAYARTDGTYDLTPDYNFS